MRLRPLIFSREYVALVPGLDGLEMLRFRIRSGKAVLQDRHSLTLPVEASARADALWQAMAARKWNTLPCVLCLRSTHLAVRCLKPPPLRSADSLRQLVRRHSRDFEALSDSRAVTEFSMGVWGANRALVLFTVREDTLLREVSVVRSAGLKLLDVLPFPLAYYEGVRQRVSPGDRDPLFCVYIAGDRCECMAGIGMAVHDLRTLQIPGARLQPEAAEPGPAPDMPPSYTQRWIQEVVAALREFQASLPETNLIKTVWIAGEIVPAPEVLSHLSRETSVPVKVLETLDPAPVIGQGLSRTCLVTDRSQQVSLLPRDLQLARHRRRSGLLWAAVYGLIFVSLSMLSMHAHRVNRSLARRTVQAREHLEAFQAVEAERAELAERMAGLSGTVLPLRDAARNYPRMARVLDAVQEARDPLDWFVLAADADAYFSDLSPRRLPPPMAGRISTVILEGYTPVEDLSTVRHMIEALRLHPFIESVDLLPDDQIRRRSVVSEMWNLEGLRRFALEIRLRGRPQ
ncbi:MAG: hypothetical protein JJU05_12580 [Verrucomicrobia bacterium]|nr:hypothetical protein [Verrucomicrobiota bacterium]MCH8528393.1 hypothetical protein [Kiritimatiellia bacterium]